MKGKDKMIIELNGRMVEIPLHLVGIEIQPVRNNRKEPPTLIISSIAKTKDEMTYWGDLAAGVSHLPKE